MVVFAQARGEEKNQQQGHMALRREGNLNSTLNQFA